MNRTGNFRGRMSQEESSDPAVYERVQRQRHKAAGLQRNDDRIVDKPMNLVRLTPVFLSVLLLGAHLFRAGQPVLVLLVLIIPLVLFVHRPWAVRIVQVELIAGAIEWIRTTVVLAMARESLGLPWSRLVGILGAVTLLTVISVFVFESDSLRKRYQLRQPSLRTKP